nr:EAL domain-containing protein [Marinobacterium ramblicola]
MVDARERGVSNISGQIKRECRDIQRYALLALVVWSLLFLGGFVEYDTLTEERSVTLAREAAKANINRDIALRNWINQHGGLYIETSEHTPPNSALDASTHGLLTPDGRQLTLMSSDYLIRHFYEHFGEQLGVESRLISASPLSNLERPDPWERKKLDWLIETRHNETFELIESDSRPALRMIQRLGLESRCQGCHLRRSVGDDVGAISVSVPLTPFRQHQAELLRPVYLGGGAFWFCGSGIILLISELRRRRALERHEASSELRQAATVFLSSHEGVVIASLQGDVLAVNPAFTSITGYSQEEIRGQNLNILQSGRQSSGFYDEMWSAIQQRGFWRGEIWNRRKSGEIYPEWLTISTVFDEQGDPVNYVGVFSDISVIKQSQEQLEYLAYHDPLTALPNRAMMRDRLGHAVERLHRSGGQGAVMFLDLDRFKSVNDSYGHRAGDRVLREVARRLKTRLREGDTLARLGGDEFVVLLEDLVNPQSVAAVASDLIALFDELFDIGDGRHVSLGLSIGICLFPEDAGRTDEILQYADAALYQAKEGGRNTYRFYTDALTRSAREKLALEAALSLALEREEFVLHYQPLVRLSDREITGVEALLRWHHPERGMLAPEAFIPLAEETRLILSIGEWVLHQACRQLRSWLDQGLVLSTLSINLSPVQFHHQGLVDSIERVLRETGVPPELIELEVTESALMDPIGSVEERIARLKALGVRLAIDDFGTGYSSLSYLRRFDINRLKIARSFISSLEEGEVDQPLVTSIVTLARSLKLQVLAEGVERDSQLGCLSMLGCDFGQGYLFGHPLPPDELDLLMQNR